MFALVFLPIVALWAVDNHEFLAKAGDAPWHYVGVQDRPAGALPNGAASLPLQVGDHTFILFKQAPSEAAADPSVAAYPDRAVDQVAAR
ncbi:MAG: hypothetical protein VW338_15710 [Rhodospirillaceae bacterium]